MRRDCSDLAAPDLQIVPPPAGKGRELASRSLIYERVLGEVGRRVDRVHRVLRQRGEVLPEALPMGRDLTPEEVEELAWRVYTLACVTHSSLVRCHPALVLMAGEWMASPEPRVWEAFCEMNLPV